MTRPRRTPVDPVPPADKVMVAASAVASVVGAWVWANVPVPDEMTKLELLDTVTVPLDVSPEVAVMRPEMVGVAVQLVGLTVKVVAALPREVEVELVVPRFKAPAESTAMVPEVAVWMVRLPEVLVQLDVPPEAMTKAPVELPMLVAAVPVALILVVPVTVNPPVPWIRPVPELTPTTTKAPALEIFHVLEVPEISLPVPELAMTNTSPDAEAYDWVRVSIFPVSVQVPAPEQLEEKLAKSPATVAAVPDATLFVRFRKRKFPL